MENKHRFVTAPQHKKNLREGDGIGTSATRASILTELKRRRFLESKGKKILSTELGRSVVDSLQSAVTSPGLTALYERMLKGIESGEEQISNFMAKQEAYSKASG
jgi:DNA topoisomerase-3